MVKKLKAAGFHGAGSPPPERRPEQLPQPGDLARLAQGSESGIGIRRVSGAGTVAVVLFTYLMLTMSHERRQVARRFGASLGRDRGRDYMSSTATNHPATLGTGRHLTPTPSDAGITNDASNDGDGHRDMVGYTHYFSSRHGHLDITPAVLTTATRTVATPVPPPEQPPPPERPTGAAASAPALEPAGCERTDTPTGWRSPTIRHIEKMLPNMFSYKREDSKLV